MIAMMMFDARGYQLFSMCLCLNEVPPLSKSIAVVSIQRLVVTRCSGGMPLERRFQVG